MTDVESSKSGRDGLLRKLLAAFSLAWVTHLVELAHALYQLIVLDRHSGLYEILEYDTTLELCDPRGRDAVFHKHQRVRFLNNVIAFQDFAWGEGTNIFATYHCEPGVVVDRYQEGDRWNILISLRGTKRRGDVEDFYIERQVENGFTKAEEWCQVEIRNPTQKLRIAILFPKARRCRRAQLVERSRQRTTVLGTECFHDLPDGRQMLRWEAQDIKRLEIYTINWWW